jgi:hypothetical protein
MLSSSKEGYRVRYWLCITPIIIMTMFYPKTSKKHQALKKAEIKQQRELRSKKL